MPRSYAASVATAQRLIDSFLEQGNPPSVLQKEIRTGLDYNPDISIVNHDCKAVSIALDSKLIDGTTILRTDRRFYLSTEDLTVDPEIGDGFIGPDGTQMTIIEPLTPLVPGTTSIFWDIYTRA